MNVRDPFNLRNGSLNRPPIATWKSNKSYQAQNNSNNFAPLHHIIRTAAAATQSAAADLRDKASEAVQSAQQALTDTASSIPLDFDVDIDLEKASSPKRNRHSQQQHNVPLNPRPKPTTTTTTPLPAAGPPSLQNNKKDKDMSFAIPKNVPSFSNPQRQLEDHVWGASAHSRQRSTAASLVGGVQDFLGSSNHNRAAGLPMYKDKPYGYVPGGGGGAAGWGRRPVYRRKRSCGLLVVVLVGLVWWTGVFGAGARRGEVVGRLGKWGWLGQEDGVGSKVDWEGRRERVVEAMELSWDAYERYAWGELFLLKGFGFLRGWMDGEGRGMDGMVG